MVNLHVLGLKEHLKQLNGIKLKRIEILENITDSRAVLLNNSNFLLQAVVKNLKATVVYLIKTFI